MSWKLETVILTCQGEEMKKEDPTARRFILLLSVFFSIMLVLSILSLPYIHLLSKPEQQQQLKTWASSSGVGGWFIVLCIQIIQIILVWIPGEPVEVLAGVLYGGFGGLFLCLFGCVIASSGVFVLSKRFGSPLAAKLFKKKKLDEFAFLKDAKKLETIVFVLFLLPGTPKDMLTYVIGTSSMKLSKFLAISIFARIPSVISSTFVGATLRQGKWETAALIFAITAVLGVMGIKHQEGVLGLCKKMIRRMKGTEHEEEKL